MLQYVEKLNDPEGPPTDEEKVQAEIICQLHLHGGEWEIAELHEHIDQHCSSTSVEEEEVVKSQRFQDALNDLVRQRKVDIIGRVACVLNA